MVDPELEIFSQLRYAVRFSLAYIRRLESEVTGQDKLLKRYHDFTVTVEQYLESTESMSNEERMLQGFTDHLDTIVDALAAAYRVSRGELVARAIVYLYQASKKSE